MIVAERVLIIVLATGCAASVGKLVVDIETIANRTSDMPQTFVSTHFDTEQRGERLSHERDPERAARELPAQPQQHSCETARAFALAAQTAQRTHRLRAAYAAALSGLRYVPACEDRTIQTAAEGELLSFKAFAEHALGTGNWRADFDVADLLLVQCQMMDRRASPALGARCEALENANVAEKVDWDTDS
jgi:hypothetical protein